MPKPGKFEPIVYNDVYPRYSGGDFGQQMCGWQERINMERMRNERAEKLRSAMKEADVAVMLLFNPANIRYGTGVNISTFAVGLGYAVFPQEGEPIIYGHGTCTIQDSRQVTWIKRENYRISIPAGVGTFATGLWTHPPARQYQLEKLGDQIKDALVEVGLANEIVALDINDGALISTLERLGVKCSVRPDIPIKAQEIKTKEEIECLRIAAAITDVVHYEIAKFAEPGKTDYEIGGYAAYIGMKHGSEIARRGAVMSGRYTWPNYRMVGGRMLRPGDIFYVDITQLSWEGYLTCYYRTFSVLTEPSQAANDAYKRVYDWLYGALEDCKPGNTTADMLRHFPDEKEYWGIDPDYAWGDNVMHGIGITMYGPPHASRAWGLEHPYELKAGHAFAIETQDGIGDGQGVRLEEMVVVTEGGCEVLSRYPADEIIVCPLR